MPYYKTENWNKLKAGIVSENFTQVDLTLEEKIKSLNEELQKISKRNGISVPKFGLDMIKCRKSKCSKSQKVNYELLNDDGIHPSPILSEYWVRRIALVLLVPCCFS